MPSVDHTPSVEDLRYQINVLEEDNARQHREITRMRQRDREQRRELGELRTALYERQR